MQDDRGDLKVSAAKPQHFPVLRESSQERAVNASKSEECGDIQMYTHRTSRRNSCEYLPFATRCCLSWFN